jgi:hypothetical protein
MKTKLTVLVAGMWLSCGSGTLATIYYVDLNSSNPAPPYTNWATAATNIQLAVDLAEGGDEVVVASGTYAIGGRVGRGAAISRVAVRNPITVRGVNGPEATIIDGGGQVQCAYLTNGATLSGFTLKGGHTDVRYGASPGAGVYGESTNAVVTNCTLSGNWVVGSSSQGGGAYGGTLNNCTLINNRADGDGGGAAYSTLNNCTLNGNSAAGRLTGPPGPPSGGGAYHCVLDECTLTGNSSINGGGAAYCTLIRCLLNGNQGNGAPFGSSWGGGAYSCTLYSCTLTNNSITANTAWGGGASFSTLYNCTLSGNSVSGTYAEGGATFQCTLKDCTVIGNQASYLGGGTFAGWCYNCVVYGNSAPDGANYATNSTLTYCCTTPQPSSGVGNITNAPLFGAGFRLESNSPCINAGNNAYVDVGSNDLDGNPRIVGGTVDIGAYEYQAPRSLISYAWLQQYGLPTDGSADKIDSDGDGMNNWQEWIAGLDPTNLASVLVLLPPVPTTIPLGLRIEWQSVTNRTYYLQRANDLRGPPAFLTIQSNIIGQDRTTSYTDTNAAGFGPLFYRVGVGE